MALDTKISLSILSTLTSALDLVTSTSPLAYPTTWEWDSGTAADQADRIWTDTRTITASGTDDLDLAGGLTDAFGTAITFARVRALLVTADPTNTNLVILGNAAANGWSGTNTPFTATTTTHRIQPGGLNLYIAPQADGFPVTAGTADILRVTNSAGGTPVTYTIIIIGCSA